MMVPAEDWEVEDNAEKEGNTAQELVQSSEGLPMCRAVGSHHNITKVRLERRAPVCQAGLGGGCGDSHLD